MSVFALGKAFLNKFPCFLTFSSVMYSMLSCNHLKIGRYNKLDKSKAFLSKTKIKVIGKNNQIIFGNRVFVKKSDITIHGNNNVVIIKDMACLHETSIVIEDDNNTIIIGEKTLICGPSHIAAIEGTSVEIGDNCLFSSQTHIRTGDSHSVLDLENNRINPSKNVCIGNHVWLGYRVVLSKGSKISDDSIVSLGAIVTKEFDESNVILGGVPAKVIKRDVNWDKERISPKSGG